MAGSLISTNEDTSAFITALLDGRVVPPAQLREMMDTVDWADAGPAFAMGWASPVLTWTVVSKCGLTAATSKATTA
jgi:D-alanyl-D-alanine carboxypeptidase